MNRGLNQASAKIVYFASDLTRIKVAAREKLLWPCNAYRIGLPVSRRKTRNIFQETVLRFAAAGVREPARIAELCCLDEELVAFILSSLVQKNLLSPRFEPCSNVDEAIGRSSGDESEETAVVFVDLIGGNTLPTIHPGQLKLARIVNTGKKSITFYDGSSGREKRQRARPLDHNEIYVQKRPTPSEIGDIVRLQVRRQRRLAFSHAVGMGIQDVPKKVEGISIAPEPELVYLHVECVIQRGQFDPVITDPFGYGFSRQLRKTYKAYAMEEPREASLLRNLLEESQIHGLDQTEAYQTVGSGTYDEVTFHISEAQRKCNQVRTANRSTEAEQYKRSAAADCWSALYAAIEFALQYVVRSHQPQQGMEDLLIANANSDNGQLLSDIAKKIGFVVQGDSLALLHIPGGKVADLRIRLEKDLQPLLALALAGAADEQDHPMRQLADNQPEWINYLYHLRRERGAATHGNFALVAVSAAALEQDCKEAIDAISLLLPDYLPSNRNLVSNTDSAEAKNINKRLQAKIAVIKRIDLFRLEELPQELRENLITLEMALAEAIANSNGSLANGMIPLRAMYSTLQIALQELISTLPTINRVAVNARRTLPQKASAAGFDVPDMEFPKAIITVKQERFLKAVKGQNQTLGAAFLALILRADQASLSALAATVRDLPAFVAEICELRGHTNKQFSIETKMLLGIADKLFQTTFTLMELRDEQK